MRIAICDDNIADRRHAERLLKRESDRVHSLGEESYVIDCYGNTGKLYPMADTYDIFLIDMVDDPEENGMHIARALRERGIPSPIILCSSRIDYRALSAETDTNFFYLSKPCETEPLIQMLRQAEQHIVHREGRIELRTDGETIYVSPEDILYATPAEYGFLTVAVKGREPVRIMSDAFSLFKQIQGMKKDPAILAISGRAFINARALQSTGFLSVTMEDGRKLSVAPSFALAGNIREARNFRRKMDQ
ncbi:MAG: hypothetical protein II800_06560 [Lachnospiraceae bacterium]|nr:hypothetical protein [Lachnospiraceae bacterium]